MMSATASKVISNDAHDQLAVRAIVELQCIDRLRYESGEPGRVPLPSWTEFVITWAVVAGTGSWECTVIAAMGRST